MIFESLTGLAIGFFGSFHCIGMCGPIALSLPVRFSSNFKNFLAAFIYNTGRMLTYSFLGLVFGILGNRLVISGFQHALSISVGAIIIIYLLIPQTLKNRLLLLKPVSAFNSKVKAKLGKFLSKGKFTSLLVIGLLNGLLPCGFVYMGLGGAIALGDPVQSMLFMLFFGLGTFPAMFAPIILKNKFSLASRQRITKLLPYLAFILGVIFILRGLNLGIPYVSPKLNSISTAQEYCQPK
ncbi:MAG: sulfite exporter TauE/SafE family protein [Ignavibacteria bacterium]|nr:MAG: sulfite exporter TauE/SafE family protein [Ignavibacteria bacterium]